MISLSIPHLSQRLLSHAELRNKYVKQAPKIVAKPLYRPKDLSRVSSVSSASSPPTSARSSRSSSLDIVEAGKSEAAEADATWVVTEQLQLSRKKTASASPVGKFDKMARSERLEVNGLLFHTYIN